MPSDGSTMAKKKSWFSRLKRFFISDTGSKSDKEKRKRTWIFGRLKIKRLPSIAAAPSAASQVRTLSEAEEEHSKQALNVAIATAAAAEAAVAAAEAAAGLVRLTGTSQSIHQCEREKREDSPIEIKIDAPQSTNQYEREIQELAAIKIQTAFRGCLARKALRALKGIVKLQAIIRGRNVRRQAITTLKCLQSIVNIQSQMDSNSRRRWDDSTLPKEEADALFQSKKEAFIKRERAKEYAFSHRKSAESEQDKGHGRWRLWLEQWVDTQVMKSKELEDLDTVWTSDRKPKEEYRGKGLRLKNLQRQYQVEGLDSPSLVPRRSMHRRQCSLGEENSFSSSPVVPTYMAATESAKAKARSMSSPKLRTSSFDTCSESYSPCKNKLSLVSPVRSEVSSCGRIGIGRPSAYQQRSPSLKGVQGPVKSYQIKAAKDLSFNSECSILNWDRQSTSR
ncbi:hypothetical protein Patl1_17068 [Pistacia atlantica]|uniref:Uncharacterized protein n=1 Tax=Pistacia atlantica TaxID=434234 RepID=A0ACC1B9P8_9ROSI|nr:hypothetical protein Patl1_17068 [Pistacia atlantica]